MRNKAYANIGDQSIDVKRIIFLFYVHVCIVLSLHLNHMYLYTKEYEKGEKEFMGLIQASNFTCDQSNADEESLLISALNSMWFVPCEVWPFFLS